MHLSNRVPPSTDLHKCVLVASLVGFGRFVRPYVPVGSVPVHCLWDGGKSMGLVGVAAFGGHAVKSTFTEVCGGEGERRWGL